MFEDPRKPVAASPREALHRWLAAVYHSKLLRPFARFWEVRRGRPWERRMQRQVLTHLPSVREAAARWTAGAGAAEATDRPVFLMSAGWRSGSTLLQRLIMSSGDVFLWGEPYAECGLVERLSSSIRPFGQETYPPRRYLLGSRDSGQLADEWIATLYPAQADLLEAHRSFFRTAYAAPAAAMGFSRWGMKTVRLGAESAYYLQALFPLARFVFLYRNPYHAWRSYRQARGWYWRWPEEPIFTPGEFGRMWLNLTTGFLEAEATVPSVVARYEEIGREDTLERMSALLGVQVSRAPLEKVVRGLPKPADSFPRDEERALRQAVDPVAARLGYHGP